MSKQVKFSLEASTLLANGAQRLTDAVKITLGAKGRNALIERNFNTPIITKDGVTVAKSVESEDPIENMAIKLLKQVAINVAKSAGDGTTTSTVLANEIFQKGLQVVALKHNPIELKRGFEKAKKDIKNTLKKFSKKITNDQELEDIASISANGDTEIGKMISKAILSVGEHGLVNVQKSDFFEDTIDITNGLKFNRGYLSPYFINNKENFSTEMENPRFLLSKDKIRSLNEIMPILEYCNKESLPLVIIAEDFDTGVIQSLGANSLQGILNVVAVKIPALGQRGKDELDDIAVLTDSVCFDREKNVLFSSFQFSNLGTASTVTVTADDTTIIQTENDLISKNVTERIKELNFEFNKPNSSFDKTKLEERIAKLAGGVAIIKVGANTEAEMLERKDRIDDAVAATFSAREQGIVIGGGAALLHVQNYISTADASENFNSCSKVEQIGYDILLGSISEPFKQILRNAGISYEIKGNEILSSKHPNIGFNLVSEKTEDLFESGIIDPLKVVLEALDNSVSAAGILLTTEVVLYDNPSIDKK